VLKVETNVIRKGKKDIRFLFVFIRVLLNRLKLSKNMPDGLMVGTKRMTLGV
jgi:hypothetical protein